MADESSATEQVATAFRVVEVPTFIFMRNGKEVARHVGSSRGDLIGRILQVNWEGSIELRAVGGGASCGCWGGEYPAGNGRGFFLQEGEGSILQAFCKKWYYPAPFLQAGINPSRGSFWRAFTEVLVCFHTGPWDSEASGGGGCGAATWESCACLSCQAI